MNSVSELVVYRNLTLHHTEGFIALESSKNPGQHVGIRPDGTVKPPTETGKGEHGQFAVIIKSKVTTQ